MTTVEPRIVNLSPHASAPARHVSRVRVQANALPDGGLHLRYAVDAEQASLRLPLPLPGLTARDAFADGLWRHTCLEAFVAVDGQPHYREFNFSPSGQWAAYAFDAYRHRDEAWQPADTPRMQWHPGAHALVLEVTLAAALLPAPAEQLQIGLTAVLEAADGGLSYWALAHPGTKPDFHLREAFMLRLADDPTSP